MFSPSSLLHTSRFVSSNRKVVLSILAIVSLAAAISLSLRLAQSAPAGPASPPLLLPPVVTLNVPGEVLIGEDFEFEVKFDNATGSDTGFAPYIDLYLPATGADGNSGGDKCDGIKFLSADAVFTSPQTVPLPAAYNSGINLANECPNSFTHPFTGATVLPLTSPQYQLVVLALPFGSFDTTQPEILVKVKAHLSRYADVGIPSVPTPPLTIHAKGGFRYGKTAVDEPLQADPLVESNPAVTMQTNPTLFRLKKEYLGLENEAVSGPNFTSYYPLHYELTADIANKQKIKDLVLTDNLPGNLQFGGNVQVTIKGNNAIPVTTCSLTKPLEVMIAAPLPAVPNGSLSVTLCEEIEGSTSPKDVVVKFDFYIPDVDINGQLIINNCANAPVAVKNDILATGKWDPLDPRDPTSMPGDTVPVNSDLTNIDHLLQAKCLAIQKSVQVSEEWQDGEIGPTPGDILVYQLNFQVSDYFTIGQLVVTDFLADGQDLQTTPAATFTVTDLFGTTSSSSVSVTTTPDTLVPGFCPDTPPFKSPTIGTTLRFDVSSAMSNPPSTVSRHNAGLLTGGHAAGPATPTPATGTIVFYAKIRDTFKPPVAAPHEFVDKHDPINNCVKIEGAVYDNLPRPSPVNAPLDIPTVILGSSVDTSAKQRTIVTDTLEKSVYAVRRSGTFICGPSLVLPSGPSCLNLPGPPQEVRPGDEVTFRIEKTIPSSDAEDLTVEDWLPLPIFHVNDPDADTIDNGWTFGPPTSSPPSPGTAAQLSPDHTLAETPTFLPLPATNSLQFDYGTFNSTANKKGKIDLLFTMTVTNDPFADNLFLTNEVRESESGTFGGPFQQTSIAQVNLREPDLRIRKGVIATDNPIGLFNPPSPPSTAPPAPPGATLSLGGIAGVVNSNDLATGVLNSNISNVDANDLVTFAITIENQGGHPAFDVKMDEIIPLDTFGNPSCFTIDQSTVKVQLGTGVPVNPARYVLTPTLSGGFSLALLDSIPELNALNPSTGDNIIVITFQVRLKADITPGCCQNEARITQYTSVAGGLGDFVTAGLNGPYVDAAEVCARPTLTKSVVATSEPHTGPETSALGTPEVTIGEIVRYRLEVRLPEGSSPNLQITDSLPGGMKFLDGGTTRVAFVSNGAGITRSAIFNASFDVPGSAPPPSATLDALPPVPPAPPGAITGGTGCGVPVNFNLGNVMNNDNDGDLEYVVIEFNALVCNETGNTEGTTLSNTFSVSVNNSTIIGSNAINVIVREPNLTIAKVASPSTVVQGVTVPYIVTITNSSVVDAFDVQFTDTLPSGLFLDPTSVTVTGCSSPTVVNTVPSVTCARIPVGDVVTIRYKALADPITCPVTLTNNARTTWTSLPGSNGTTTNSLPMSTTPGPSGAVEGERNGVTLPLTLNDYAASASAALSVRCPPCVDAPEDMVAWWPLDEPNGSTVVNDLAEFNNHGNPKTGTTLGSPNAPNAVPGRVNGAVSFNSNLQTGGPHLEVFNQAEINFGTGDLSIDAWVFVPPPPAVYIHPIVDKLDMTAKTGYALRLVSSVTNSAHIEFEMGDGSIANYSSSTLRMVPFDRWTHVAVTVNRTSRTVTFYVDGASSVITDTSMPLGSLDNTLPLLIGESRLPGLSQAAITIDELEMFSRALDQTEIQSIFGARSGGKCKCPLITLNPAAGALPATLINSPYKLTFTAGGGCSSLFTFSVTSGSLPPGLTLSPGGVLSGTPTQTGIFTFTVTATDSCGCTKSQTYTLSVDNCPMVPLRLFNTGVANDGSLLAAGAPDPHYALVNTGSDPPPVPPPAIVLAQNEIQAYVDNNAISQWIGPNVTPLGDSPVGFYTYRVTFDMPAGADLNTVIISGQWASDNDAVIVLNGEATAFTTGPADFESFTPFAITGTANFLQNTNLLEFKVRNRGVGGGTSPTATGLRVEINGSVTCCPQPNKGTVIIRKNTVGGDNTFGYTTTGAGLSAFNITTSGGTQSQTFSNISLGAKTVTESSLPSGWSFNSLTCSDPDGGTTVSGQTANIDLDAGETVMCTYTNTRCAITLNPAAGPLTPAVVNTPYSQTFTATGGSCGAPTFSVTSGALPPGLTLGANGVLSGAATQSGNFTFTLTASDSCGCSQSQTYTLNVACASPQACPLVISGFRQNGPVGSKDEFVEIFNPSDSPVLVSACSNDPAGSANGIGVFASAGNGTTSNAVSLVCQIPGSTVIQGRSYFLCGGKDYSLGALGSNGAASHSVPDRIIGTGNAFVDDIPNDAGLALLNIGTSIVVACPIGSFNCCSGFNFSGSGANGIAVYDKVGFNPYGAGAPAAGRPTFADNYCETKCLAPVGDASVNTAGALGGTCPGTVTQAGASFTVLQQGLINGVAQCYGESGQYQIGRRRSAQQFNVSTGSLHRDTDNNADDFILLAPNPSAANVGLAITGNGGLTSVLGAAGPHSTKSPPIVGQGIYTGAAFDLGNPTQSGPGNAERQYGSGSNILNPNNNPQGTLLLRIRFTNNGPAAVSGVRFRIDDISGLCGPQSGAYATGVGAGSPHTPPPTTFGSTAQTATQEARNLRPLTPSCQGEGSDNGLFTAVLKGVNHNAEFVSQPSDGTFFFVNGSSLEDVGLGAFGLTALSPLGGGGNNSYVINSNLSPTAVGDGVSGGPGSFTVAQPNVGSTSSSSRVLRVGFKFGVVKSGRFKLLIGREVASP